MAGHILLHILTGFILQLSKINLVLGIFPFLVVWAILILELGISFLQAYVFLVLLTIYFEENLNFSQDQMYLNKIYLNINTFENELNLVKFNSF